MTEPLQHDPRTKKQIKDLVYEALYSRVDKQFEARIDALIGRNTVLLGCSHSSFLYKGVLYTCEPSQPPITPNRLIPQLRPEMETYLKDIQALNSYEIPYVLGFLSSMLNRTNSLQDYLKILPESVHSPIKQLASTCPCGFAHLTPDQITQLQEKNELPISLMKQRMVLNLIT